MGARAQVHIKETGVYLYTHWGSRLLKNKVAKALNKRWRWNDISYLTRIIFEEMVENEQGTETGFGISTTSAGDAEYTIHILPGNKVEIVGEEQGYEKTFEEFIEEFL